MIGPLAKEPLWKVRLGAYKKFGFDAWVWSEINYKPSYEIEEKILSKDNNRLVVQRIHHTKAGDLSETTVYPKYDGWWVTEHLVKDPLNDLAKIEAMLDYDPEKNFNANDLNDAIKGIGEDGLVIVPHSAPLDWWFQLCGNERGIISFNDYYDKIKHALEKYEELVRKQIKVEVKQGAEIIHTGGSYTSISLISPKWYKDYVFPFLKRTAELCHKLGVLLEVQINGKCNEILELLAEAGIDCTEPLERPPLGNVNIEDAKKRIGKTVCLKGNVDPINTLLKGKPKDVEKEIRDIIEKSGEGGGLIISTSDQVVRDTPIENMEAFAKTKRTI